MFNLFKKIFNYEIEESVKGLLWQFITIHSDWQVFLAKNNCLVSEIDTYQEFVSKPATWFIHYFIEVIIFSAYFMQLFVLILFGLQMILFCSDNNSKEINILPTTLKDITKTPFKFMALPIEIL